MRPKITPSLLISILALVVALGGTSYAAAKINGKNIQAKTISASKLQKNTIGSNRIKDGKVKAKDLAPGLADQKARWAFVDRNGNIAAQSGGFTLVAGYPGDASSPANGNVYINAGEDLGTSGIVATIALQNRDDQGGPADVNNGTAPGADANPEFSGEISVSRCNLGAASSATAVGPTNCAPAGAQNLSSFVVSPRLSDGTRTDPANRKAFYVVVTG